MWKEALDGTVTLASPAAVETLRVARAMVGAFIDAEVRRRWIDEAIEQVREGKAG